MDGIDLVLQNQELGSVFLNPLKYAIRGAVMAGVPANTIILLLLLPVVALFIAAARHVIGLRGYGIFLPAALSVVFVAIGPLVGVVLFLVIVTYSVSIRFFLRKSKIRLQYLPRMALVLWFVVLGVLSVLFIAPVTRIEGLTNVSIFPVLVLVLLAEDFSKIQLGKSARTAVTMATETVALSLISYYFLTLESVRSFAILHPELLIVSVALADFIVGKYIGLRVMEYWRYRKLLKN